MNQDNHNFLDSPSFLKPPWIGSAIMIYRYMYDDSVCFKTLMDQTNFTLYMDRDCTCS